MVKQYKIREGFSFIDENSGKLVGGEVITLDDDVAAQHLHKLEEVQASKQVKSAKAAPKPADPAPAAEATAQVDPAPAADADPSGDDVAKTE
jgi:hypothetical protein